MKSISSCSVTERGGKQGGRRQLRLAAAAERNDNRSHAIAASAEASPHDLSLSARNYGTLYRGAYQDALRDVIADTLICDPPFSARTHAGQRCTRKDGSVGLASHGLGYSHWSPRQCRAFVFDWSHRVRAWFCVFCSHDLIEVYSSALAECGRYVFAPVACVQTGQNVRLHGDGPSNWTTYLIVARPRGMKWRSLPGAYVGTPYDVNGGARPKRKRLDVPAQARAQRAARGSKPLWLMRSIVQDYSRAGALVVDPCAGRGTTLLAAALSGRDFVGAEMRSDVHQQSIEYLTARGVGVVSRTLLSPKHVRISTHHPQSSAAHAGSIAL